MHDSDLHKVTIDSENIKVSLGDEVSNTGIFNIDEIDNKTVKVVITDPNGEDHVFTYNIDKANHANNFIVKFLSHDDISYGENSHSLATFGEFNALKDSVKDTIKNVNILDNQYILPEGLLRDLANLETVNISPSIDTLLSSAFNNLLNLKEINVDNSNKTFKSIDGNLYSKDGSTLIRYAIGKADTSFLIDKNIDSIDVNAFNLDINKSKLTTIRAYLKHKEALALAGIDVSALGPVIWLDANNKPFSYKVEGSDVWLSGSLEDINKTVITKITELEINSSNITIPPYTFDYAKKLEKIVIKGDGVTLGERAFNNCPNLLTVELGDGVEVIGNHAFYNCTKIETLILAPSVKKIEEGAFKLCTSIVKLVLHEGLEEIGKNAFQQCTTLKSITIPSSVRIIREGAFMHCWSVTELIIKDGVTTIESNAFSNFRSLETVDLPNTVKTIKSNTFAGGAAKVTSIVIPEGIETIETGAFSAFFNVKSATIPASLKTIGNNSLGFAYNCKYTVSPDSLYFTTNSNGGLISK